MFKGLLLVFRVKSGRLFQAIVFFFKNIQIFFLSLFFFMDRELADIINDQKRRARSGRGNRRGVRNAATVVCSFIIFLLSLENSQTVLQESGADSASSESTTQQTNKHHHKTQILHYTTTSPRFFTVHYYALFTFIFIFNNVL